MPLQEIQINKNITAVSGEDAMSDIAVLTARIQEVGNVYDWWTSATILLVALSAIITLLYFGASVMSFRKGSELRRLQDELSAAKDRELSTNLKEKDLRMAEARAKYGELESKNLETAQTLEAEKTQRLELEEYISPRSLITTPNTIERLRAFKGTPFMIECLPDPEAERTAGLINSVLERAEWKQLGFFIGASQPYGVETQTMGSSLLNAVRPSKTAASELISYLRANRWEAKDIRAKIIGSWDKTPTVPDGTVKVLVGLKKMWGKSDFSDLFDTKAYDDFKLQQKEENEVLRKEWGIDKESLSNLMNPPK